MSGDHKIELKKQSKLRKLKRIESYQLKIEEFEDEKLG